MPQADADIHRLSVSCCEGEDLKNLGIDVIMRVYVPDLEKMKTWKAPKAEKVK